MTTPAQPLAYRVFSPQGEMTYADGLASYGPGQAPPTWFVRGVAYIDAHHPRCPYYVTSGAYAVEPVASIPQDYKDEAARLTAQPEQHLGAPTHDYGRTDPTHPLPR